jgi:hypothetical protein
MQDLAFIYALNGDTEAAVQQLEYLLSIPSWISVSWLRMDPEWDLLRDTPAFNRILARTAELGQASGGIVSPKCGRTLTLAIGPPMMRPYR